MTSIKWAAMGAALLSVLWGASGSPAHAQGAAGTLLIDVAKPGAAISPTLFGVFFEEINHAGDGGLYGELLQNRAFEDKASLLGWAPAPNVGGAVASTALDNLSPLSQQSPHSLRLDIKNAGPLGAGVVNSGYWGVPVKIGEKYRFSFYAKSLALRYPGTVRVRLEGAKRQVYAEAVVSGLDNTWKQFSGEMSARGTARGVVDPSAKFVLLGTAPGTLWLDGTSLFGPTYKNRPNGLRPDLAQLTADLKPAFIRFPGGCFVEGDYLANAFRWKNTIGEPVLRPGHQNLWGYRSSDGLGYHDYLQMCEDLNALPLYVVNCGMSHNDTVPLIDIDPWIQDALDALDYANAPTSNPWGKLRADAGHKAPFNVRYVEVGNENGGQAYEERFARFQAAIKARYPSVNIIVNNWNGVPQTVPYDLVDDHIYTTANALAARADQYDSRSRLTKAKIYVGEYAVTQGAGQGNLRAALGEAAYMTGLERNGDVVAMASYAPLFVNVNDRKWNPDAIVYDNYRSYGTPSYYVQKLFRANQGGTVLSTTLQTAQASASAPVANISGAVGVGTWKTQAEFRNLAVTTDIGKIVIGTGDTASALADSNDLPLNWRTLGAGKWQQKKGVLVQNSTAENVRAISSTTAEGENYSVSLQARKTSGSEGFLILLGIKNDQTLYWWNVGGWNNTLSGVERFEDGGSETLGERVPTVIETGKWYDIRIDVAGSHLRCFLDGKLLQDVDTAQARNTVLANATRDAKTGEVVVKVVNRGNTAQNLNLILSGASVVGPGGVETVLASTSPDDENSFAAPLKIAPQTRLINGFAPTFPRTFAPYSLTILRFKADTAANAAPPKPARR